MHLSDRPESENRNPDPLLSMREAATYLGVSVSQIYNIAKREKFPIVFVTSDRKIRKSVLDEHIKKCEQPWRWPLLAVAMMKGA